MSLSGSPRSRCTVTVPHTLVVPRSGPSATLLRHYASRRVCQAVTCLTAPRLSGHSLPHRDLFFIRKTSIAKRRFRFGRRVSFAEQAMRLRGIRLCITSEYAHAYVLSNNWNELDSSSTKVRTRVKFNNINCNKNFKIFFLKY